MDIKLKFQWKWIFLLDSKLEDYCRTTKFILQFSMTFGWKWVLLIPRPSMFGKFSVHAWRFEWRTFQISSFRIKLILACQEVLMWVWPSMNWNRLLFVPIQTLPLGMHQFKWKEIIDYAKQPMKNHRGPTPRKSHWFQGYLYYYT
jgi:hypothetical protein